jgi:8-oxo-dGTP pyrophosphatase MutT (NUDIX family)
MTETDIELIKTNKTEFDTLWNSVWIKTDRQIKAYNKNKDREYNDAKEKYETLRSSTDSYNLEFYLTQIKPKWKSSEWGIPKGRRNISESDLRCAVREFEEETNFTRNEYVIFENIPPLEENLVGSDGISYRHIYYIGMATIDKQPSMNQNNLYQIREIGNIGWFSFSDAIKLIRPYHSDKRKVITRLHNYIIHFLLTYFNKKL